VGDLRHPHIQRPALRRRVRNQMITLAGQPVAIHPDVPGRESRAQRLEHQQRARAQSRIPHRRQNMNRW